MSSPFALKVYQDQLKSDIEKAITSFADGSALELDLSIDEADTPGVGALSTAPETLNDAVRQLVAAFNDTDVAKGGPVRARHVTAFDSDGDGKATVSIRYSYADEG